VQKGKTHPQAGGASMLDAAEEEQRTPEGATGDNRATLMAPKPEEAAHGLSQNQRRGDRPWH
jgi:hypothetical protein